MAKIAWNIILVLLFVIGLAGVPDNIAKWARWLRAIRPYVNHNFARWMFVIVAVGGLYMTNIAVQSNGGKDEAPPPSIPKIDEGKIKIRLQYAYEWDNYEGSTNELGNMSRTIDEPIVRKYSQKEMRLLAGVANFNEAIALKNVWLHIKFLDGGLNIRTDEYWREMLPNKSYFTKLGTINSGQGIHPDGNLFVKFPKPGTYAVSYAINGDGFRPIKEKFEIILK